MKRLSYAALVFRALYELTRYEVIVSLLGIGDILRNVHEQSISQKPASGESERALNWGLQRNYRSLSERGRPLG